MSLSTFIDRRIELIEARERLKQRIIDLKKDLAFINSQIGDLDNGVRLCPNRNCDFRYSFRKQLRDHLFTVHSY